jgi:hypothetical protein
MSQTKPLGRWIGQFVYRSVIPSVGPNAYKLLGYRRGVIRCICPRRGGEMLHHTEWFVGVNWHTGEVTRGEDIPKHDRFSAPFDYGLMTLDEMVILVQGGLLGKDGPVFNEPQCDSLKAVLPLYETILSRPIDDWHPWSV